MNRSKAPKKSLLELLKEDRKAEDIIKSGIAASRVYQVCEDLVSPEFIHNLDHHPHSYALFLKYGVPQPNIKTLMNLALLHLRNKPELLDDALKRHKEKKKESESRLPHCVSSQPHSPSQPPAWDCSCSHCTTAVNDGQSDSGDAADGTLSKMVGKFAKLSGQKRRIITSCSDVSDLESTSDNMKVHQHSNSSNVDVVVLSSDVSQLTKPATQKKQLKKRRRTSSSSSDSSDDSMNCEGIQPQKRVDVAARISGPMDIFSDMDDRPRPAGQRPGIVRKSNEDGEKKRKSRRVFESEDSDVSEPNSEKVMEKRNKSHHINRSRQPPMVREPPRPSKLKKMREEVANNNADNREWDLEAIIDHRMIRGKKQYKVQWATDARGEYWPESENWVWEWDMICPDLVDEYERSILRKAEASPEKSVEVKGPTREELEKHTLTVQELREKRQRENMEKTKLIIADDKDICTSSDDEAARSGRYTVDVVTAIENLRRRYRHNKW